MFNKMIIDNKKMGKKLKDTTVVLMINSSDRAHVFSAFINFKKIQTQHKSTLSANQPDVVYRSITDIKSAYVAQENNINRQTFLTALIIPKDMIAEKRDSTEIKAGTQLVASQFLYVLESDKLKNFNPPITIFFNPIYENLFRLILDPNANPNVIAQTIAGIYSKKPSGNKPFGKDGLDFMRHICQKDYPSIQALYQDIADFDFESLENQLFRQAMKVVFAHHPTLCKQLSDDSIPQELIKIIWNYSANNFGGTLSPRLK